MGSASKQKGAQFERDVCRHLSRFVDPKGTDTLFWRSSMSGGRATIETRRGIANRTQLGDITCVHAKGHWITSTYYIECKFYRDLDITSSLFNCQGRLARFWVKLVLDAKDKDRSPLLIAKENHRDTLVLLTHDLPGYDRNMRVLCQSYSMPLKPFVCYFDEIFPIRKVRK